MEEMMKEPIVIEYQTSTKATLEAMLATGRWIMGPLWWLQTVFGLIIIILVCLGGAALAIFIGVLTTDRPESALPYVWLGAISAALFLLLTQNWPPKRIAKHIVHSPYGRSVQIVTFDQTGMTIQNDHSHWQTNWAAIDNVRRGKHGIIIHVAGIAFSVPLRDITNPTEVMAQIASWRGAP